MYFIRCRSILVRGAKDRPEATRTGGGVLLQNRFKTPWELRQTLGVLEFSANQGILKPPSTLEFYSCLIFNSASFVDLLEPLAGSLSLAEADGSDDRWWRFLGRLHPLTVHFPIALALTAAVVELINIIRRKREASPFAITATGIAAVTAIFAAFFGWLNADFEGASQDTTLFLHRWLGIIGAGGLSIVFVTGLVGRTGVRITAFNGYRWGLIVCALVVGTRRALRRRDGLREGVSHQGALPGGRRRHPSTTAERRRHGRASQSRRERRRQRSRSSRTCFRSLEARCVECHGADKDKADLRLESVRRDLQRRQGVVDRASRRPRPQPLWSSGSSFPKATSTRCRPTEID